MFLVLQLPSALHPLMMQAKGRLIMLSLDMEFLPMGKLAPPPSSAYGHHTGQVPLALPSGCNTDSMPLKS